MPTHLPEGHGPSASGGIGSDPALEADDVYELQDHEFTLEADETIEIPPGPVEEPAPAVPSVPPLPRWAAASRAMLDTWVHGDPEKTIEVPPSASPARIPGPGISERAARERLQTLARRLHAREVYVLEVERALAVANGRVRGQSFRIAELEQALRERDAVARRDSTPEGESKHAPPSPPSTNPASAEARESASERTKQSARRKLPRNARAPRERAGDDLQRIRGVGPRFAERLRALGVKSFKALAVSDAKLLQRIAGELGISPQRIQRERWQAQARALSKKSAAV